MPHMRCAFTHTTWNIPKWLQIFYLPVTCYWREVLVCFHEKSSKLSTFNVRSTFHGGCHLGSHFWMKLYPCADRWFFVFSKLATAEKSEGDLISSISWIIWTANYWLKWSLQSFKQFLHWNYFFIRAFFPKTLQPHYSSSSSVHVCNKM